VITVLAASSLTDAFQAIQPEFEKASPGVKLRLEFGASSTLRTQIEQGAPVDVFAAADQEQMQPLMKAHLVEAPRPFARNRLVLVVPAANPGRIAAPLDLTRPGLRLVTTVEAVPIGRYTQELLRKLARTPGYPADFARWVNRNVVSREANVRAVLAKVELGEADAAVVYATDARFSRRVKVIPLPPAANVTAIYPIAVVTRSSNRREAETFVRFVQSRAGQQVLRRFGFF
jgi:molybdate transport system substrate-binding protein